MRHFPNISSFYNMSAIVLFLWLLTVVTMATTAARGACVSKNFTDADEFSKNFFECVFPLHKLELKCVATCLFMESRKACPWGKNSLVRLEGLKNALKIIDGCLGFEPHLCGAGWSEANVPAMGLQQDLGDFSYHCYTEGTRQDRVRWLDFTRTARYNFNETHITIPFGFLKRVEAVAFVGHPHCVFRDKEGRVVGRDQYEVVYEARYVATAAIAYTTPTPSATVAAASATKTDRSFSVSPVKKNGVSTEPRTEFKYFEGFKASGKAIAFGADDLMPYANFVAKYTL